MNILTIEVAPGADIMRTIEEARCIAGITEEQEVEVRFTFNGAEIRVCEDSPAELLYRDFMRAMYGYHTAAVGPYPPAELPDEVKASDARMKAERDAADAIRQAEYERQEAEKRARFEAEVAGVSLDLADPDGWAKFVAANDDGYGSGVVRYAEAWARLMQARMARGAELEAVASEASHDADTEGITGFMYGCAVGMLARCWRHGERLRRWHNLDTQIGAEGEKANESGGVLNPALLNVGA
jgi:hypothetical protein